MASSETASDDDALSAGSVLLSSVLNDNPELIKSLASCLDRRRFLTNWKDVAFEFGFNREFIERMQFDSVHSPTKQVLEYLMVTRPRTTIGEVMDVLRIIERLDIYTMLEEKFVPDTLLTDAIHDLDLLTTIAIKLDKTSLAIKNWRHLAHRLSVPLTVIQHLEDEQQRQEQESPTTQTIHALTTLRPDVTIADLVKVLEKLKRMDAVHIIREQFPGTLETSHPSYVVARGERMMAAYKRALETGETLDKRVKIFLIGKDRAGKTSVGKSLKGERFDPEEASTDGVQMHEPLMNAGVQPWKNSKMKKETTTYHQKCAEYIKSKNLLTESTEGQQRPKDENDVKMHMVTALGKISGIVETFEEKETIAERDQTDQDGIWPVIWDFAGQAVYRAIHPIFMSPEGVYLLVVDVTKGLSAIAQCHVKEDGSGELEMQTTDYYDTNLDHIMRWMDLVYSLRHSGNCKEFPPVILVGTHADCKDMPVKPDEAIRILKNTLCHSARVLSQCILATVIVDNTKAGQSQEDSEIVKLREKIVEVADAMPQMKIKFPLKWLQVENEVYQQAKQGVKYMNRKHFKLKIVDEICQLEKEDDFEPLLDFLHDRGTIINHDRADNPDGLVVLDPQWLIDVLCKIVKVKQEGDEGLAIFSLRQDLGEKGILDPKLLDHACKTLKLSNIKDSLLFIMKKFNLLCECKGENGKPVYLVPCMLTAKPEENMIPQAVNGSKPVYVTFDTNYVPTGLFSRLLVLFSEWAASRTTCKQQRLFANAARFVVGKSTCLSLVCNKSVIKVHIWEMDPNADPVHTAPEICSEVFSFLNESLGRLKKECHWLRLVSWKFCAQCRLCLGNVDSSTKQCFRHQKQGCSDDDCAHYVSVFDFPFCCTEVLGSDMIPPLTWIQALWDKTSNKQSVKCGKPSDDTLSGLSQKIGTSWKPLARRLKMDESKLDKFHTENDKLEEKALKMLLHWKQRDGIHATYQVLFDALSHEYVSRRDLAEEFCVADGNTS